MRMPQRLLRGPRAAVLTGLMAVALFISVLPAAADILVVDEGDEVPVIQFAGVNRFDTAGLIATDDTEARATFDDPAETVVIATGDKFPDALSATYAAGLSNSPVLLSRTPDLSEETRAVLDELQPQNYIIVGGPLAVDTSVETELATRGDVVRVGGLSRTDTAAQVARLGDADSDGALDNGETTAVVASNGEYAGALSAGPIAFAAGVPLLLTDVNNLSPETEQVIGDLGITDVIVAGGSETVSNNVVGQITTLGVNVSRVGATNPLTPDTGTDSADTGTDTQIAAAFANLAIDDYGFSENHINLATNADFADALALAAHAGADHVGPSPILLTAGDSLGDDAASFLADRAETCGLLALHVAGGDAAVSDVVVAEARAAGTPDEPCSNADIIEALAGSDSAFRHQEAFQAIAEYNAIEPAEGDTILTRAAGTPGYTDSVAYVARRLEAAGYEPVIQEFDYVLFSVNGTPQVIVDDAPLTDEQQVIMSFSGGGDVTALTQAVDLSLADPEASTSGCEPEDFAAFAEGNIALIQRGACSFAGKAQNAIDAGAVGVLVFNQGNGDDRQEVLNATLGGPLSDETVPVFGLDFATGVDLAENPRDVQLVADVENVPDTTLNVIADTPYGDPDNVVMMGAHLDSVAEGPGIQDNGSGSAGILDIALQMARSGIETENTVRFAWWGAEELGLIGSTAYIFGDGADLPGVSDEEYNAIKVYLNFDMISSPNFARFIYDGDGSGFGLVGPPGSDAIETQFEDFFEGRDLASAPTEFSGSSDYQAFIDVGIPSGGLFTGAEGIKAEEEAELFGGEAGVAYDSCYHQACDTIDNVNTEVLDQMVDAIARVSLTYADSLDGIPEREQAATFSTQGRQLGGSAHAHDHNDVDAS